MEPPPPLTTNEGTHGEWKAKATNAISQAIVSQLSDRLEDPDGDDGMGEGQCSTKKRTEKDLYGIGRGY